MHCGERAKTTLWASNVSLISAGSPRRLRQSSFALGGVKFGLPVEVHSTYLALSTESKGRMKTREVMLRREQMVSRCVEVGAARPVDPLRAVHSPH